MQILEDPIIERVFREENKAADGLIKGRAKEYCSNFDFDVVMYDVAPPFMVNYLAVDTSNNTFTRSIRFCNGHKTALTVGGSSSTHVPDH